MDLELWDCFAREKQEMISNKIGNKVFLMSYFPYTALEMTNGQMHLILVLGPPEISKI